MNKTPFTVTVNTSLFVGNRIPRSFAIALQNLSLKSLIRLAGAMENDPDEIFPFFDVALAGIDGGFLWSGATRCLKPDGSYSASVAEVVARLGQKHPNLMTGGSCPRVNRLKMAGESHLLLGEDTILNPETQYLALIQAGAEDSEALGWDGDLPAYRDFMVAARDDMGFHPGNIVWSGGGVTVTETKMIHDAGMPVFIVVGSGRQADDKLAETNFHGKMIHHVSKTDPQALRQLLQMYSMSN